MKTEKLRFILWHIYTAVKRVLKDTSGELKIEQSVYKSMTDILYPRLISFYNQPHILEEFEQWKKDKTKKKPPISKSA